MEDNNLKEFHFNTGVNGKEITHNILGGIDSGNGVIVIPFSCKDVPEKAEFLFATNTFAEDNGNRICRKIYNSKLLSKYAYFKI